jgi:hypothetical protein
MDIYAVFYLPFLVFLFRYNFGHTLFIFLTYCESRLQFHKFCKSLWSGIDCYYFELVRINNFDQIYMRFSKKAHD